MRAVLPGLLLAPQFLLVAEAAQAAEPTITVTVGVVAYLKHMAGRKQAR